MSENYFRVPQGSISEALLFILYTNDTVNVMEKCELVLYADDTLIFTECTRTTFEECYERIKKRYG